MGNKTVLRARRIFASIATVALLVGGLTALSAQSAVAAVPPPPPLLQRDGTVVTSDPIPTVQIDNGYVWAQTTIGSTVYAVGKFDNAREPLAAPGTSLTARSNVLAYDITTGQLLPFAPLVNGVIKAVAASPDGSRIYIGGSFNSVNGKDRWNFAALDAKTGQLVSGFVPSIGGTGVYAIAAAGANVYVGGLFTQGNGTARKNLAAFTAANGALLPWAPQTDLQVDAMVMDPAGQNVIAAGRFSQVNGNASLRGAAALDKSTGAPDASWALTKTVTNGSNSGESAGRSGIFGLATDTTGIYGTGWGFGGISANNLEGTFAAEAGTGKVRWIADCLGDHYGVYSTGKVVYTTSHTHACDTVGMQPEQSPRVHRYSEAFTTDARGVLGTQRADPNRYRNWAGTPAPSAYAWTPDWTVGTKTGLGQAGLSITGTGTMISIGGEFGTVNNKRFEGLVRFSTTPPGGAKDGPRLSGAKWVPTAASDLPGQAKVTIPANWDRDDLTLTYELYRHGTATPVATAKVDGTWWNRPAVTLEDRTADATAPQYTVVAKDGDGNTAVSQAVSAKVAAAPGLLLDRAGWKATADSQDSRTPAAFAIDGAASTIWHSAYTGGIAPLPHSLTLDLGSAKAIAALAYTPRQDGDTNGIISTYQVMVSADGKTWGKPIASGTFAGSSATRLVSLPRTTTRYVRLVATGSANGLGYTSAAEINLYAPRN
ncbi:discoidin domain-containing protein [Microbacterium sp. PMB16]|uniref:discoidin domain-containing protein n=1 Tax=Microbacterium sp. PMB16 TaxID=3120157 RepID=UPI003F4BD275